MGYDSPMISWTKPGIDDTIPIETTLIQIAYNVQITCSNRNISIYQIIDDTTEILRETYSAGRSNYCNVTLDQTSGKTILSLTVLPSTFNKPNSNYYIKIDANFVKQSKTLEPLFGIPKHKWVFKTGIFIINIFNIL